MKRILDAEFRYRPSFDTNVRETFEKARREQQQAKLKGLEDRVDAVLGIARDVDVDGRGGRLERGELALEQRSGHELVLAPGNARGDQRFGRVEIDDARILDPGEQALAVGLLQCRAGDDRVALVADAPVQGVEPGPAVAVLQRDAGGHLRHVLRRVILVALDEAPAKARRHEPPDRGLAGARDAHQDGDHPLWTGWPPNFARIMASSRRL